MGVSRIAYLFLLAAVAVGRLLELRVSRANQRKVMQAGGHRVAEPHFNAMVLLHTGVIVGAAVEVIVARRPLIPALAIAMGALFVLSNALRWWVIRTMRDALERGSDELRTAGRGCFRSLPLGAPPELCGGLYRNDFLAAHPYRVDHGAGRGHRQRLGARERLAVEDRVLLADPAYRAAMGAKPRFLPKFL